MYETLNAFIPFMQSGPFGKWCERVGDGTPENPYVMCHIMYDEQITRFNHTLIEWEREHTESGRFNFIEIVENSGIKFNVDSLSTEDFSTWDGITVLAMMRYVFSMERRSDGLVLEFCQNGCFLRWLQRLKDIDDNNGSTQ